MKKITIAELIGQGALYFSNVLEGIDSYAYKQIKRTEEQTIAWFLKLQNQYEIYADFYVGRIDEEARRKFKECLAVEEYEILLALIKKYEQESEEFVLIGPEIEELELLVKISYRGLLFSTFYMVDPAITIWSNFDGEFYVFGTDIKIIDKVINGN